MEIMQEEKIFYKAQSAISSEKSKKHYVQKTKIECKKKKHKKNKKQKQHLENKKYSGNKKHSSRN